MSQIKSTLAALLAVTALQPVMAAEQLEPVPAGAPDDEPREYYPVVPISENRWFKHEPPAPPPSVKVDGRTYRLPVLNRSYWGLAYETGGISLYENALAAAAPGFDVDVSAPKGVVLDGRSRIARYLYVAGRAGYGTGEVKYQSGAQQAKYDFRNLYSQGVAGLVFDILPRFNVDLYGGYGAYDFKVDDRVAKISDGGWVYGGNVSYFMSGPLQPSIGYQKVSTGSKLVDDQYSEEVVARLSLSLSKSFKLVARYASGTERLNAGFAWEFPVD